MRKVLLVLTVLALTAPCLAAVSVSCSVVGKTVTVSYDCIGDGNDIRAFGIEIDVNNGGVISNIDVNDAEYYIFPGSIDINGLGGVEAWGSAVVDQDSNSFILEMGSLYDPCDPVHKTVPPKSGTLCTFDVAVPLDGCVVTISEDTARGGVVMEDGSNYSNLPSSCPMVYSECYPAGMADWAEWDAAGRPPCWCYTRQCHGDVDNIENVEKGKLDFWVGLPDLQVLSSGWYKPDTDPNYSSFVCADFNHTAESEKGIAYTFRVGLPDLQILSAFWYGPNDGKPAPDPNCLD